VVLPKVALSLLVVQPLPRPHAQQGAGTDVLPGGQLAQLGGFFAAQPHADGRIALGGGLVEGHGRVQCDSRRAVGQLFIA
jgi:hypothetical protein